MIAAALVAVAAFFAGRFYQKEKKERSDFDKVWNGLEEEKKNGQA